MALLLHAGALIAIDRGDRKVGAMLRVAAAAGLPVRTSAAVVAQVWRGGPRNAQLAKVLAGVGVHALDPVTARPLGLLLGRAGTSDVVDGHIALLAAAGDRILTSDVSDLDRLLLARAVAATVVAV
jgi:hypothetical protein